jgi:glycosyltransferase involved in cell wall biosynthesis
MVGVWRPLVNDSSKPVMLIILSTHPIQYQVPLWQALARDGRVPFEVWYLSDHGAKISHDREFGTNFAWDLDMLSGYPHQFLRTPEGVTPASFWRCRLQERLRERMITCGASVLWIQGWQVAGYWQAVHEAQKVGVKVWLRGESNDLAPKSPLLKRTVKRFLLGWLFRRIDTFLCIGRANRRLYESYGIKEDRLISAPYCVDNERFSQQAAELRGHRAEIRRRWNIADDAFCILFCGKFISKKRPFDLVKAASTIIDANSLPSIHLLLVGSGELGDNLRSQCQTVYDAENRVPQPDQRTCRQPFASFAGFLNQSEIAKAYLAADCLVLPSSFGETWGLVVNEAMASGLPCIISDSCGCAEDLGNLADNKVYPVGDTTALADAISSVAEQQSERSAIQKALDGFSPAITVDVIARLYEERFDAVSKAWERGVRKK